MEQVLALLEEAIALHEGHMDGSVPTSPESQEELMRLLVQARDALAQMGGGGGSGGLMGLMQEMGGGMGM